jgi:hypothetical protein
MKMSVHKDQRGLSQILLIALVVLVVGGVGLVGWKVSQKDKETKSSTTAAAVDSDEIEKACLDAYKDKDLCAFTGNYDLDKVAYKMTLTSTSPEGNTTSTFESDGKGNTSVTGDFGGQKSEMISFKNVTYTKDNTDGKWFKFDNKQSGAPKEEDTNPTSDIKIDTKIDKETESKITYKKIGKEKCGKLTCFKYQVIDKENPNTTQYFWFDDEDYRMQRYFSQDATGSTDMVISYQAVKITAPSPTKEFSAGGMSEAELQALQQSYVNSTSGEAEAVPAE